MDPETQKEIKSWTFEQLRRWSQDRGVFTLDFGDWADDYLTLQTSEGEALSALIAGYIDIILKRRVDVDRVVDSDSDEIADVEHLAGDFNFASMGVTAGFTQGYQGNVGMPVSRGPGQQSSFMAQEPNTMSQSGGEGMPGPNNAANQPVLPPSSKINVVDMV